MPDTSIISGSSSIARNPLEEAWVSSELLLDVFCAVWVFVFSVSEVSELWLLEVVVVESELGWFYVSVELEILLTLLSDSEFEFGIPPAETIAGDKIRADSINKRLNISTRSSKNNYYL